MSTTPIAAQQTGSGPPVVLLHPAGFGAPILGPLVDRLATTVEVIVPDRRGYGASTGAPPPASIDEASDDLDHLLDDLGLDRVTVVGVSAGATLTLAFAHRHPDRVISALSHEPLLGPVAPDLHRLVSARIVALLDEPEDDVSQSVPIFMSELVGIPTWNHLRSEWRDDVRRNARVTRCEVALFPSFSLEPTDIASLAELGVVSSLGSRSGPARHHAAAVLAAAGMDVREIAGVGHLPFVDGLDAFAELICSVADVRVVS